MVVTVKENEIVSEEIMQRNLDQGLAVHDLVKMDSQAANSKPTSISRKSEGAVTKAKPLAHVNPAPPYPKIARERGWEGTVRLEVYVRQDGQPGRISIQESSGHDALDMSALKTVEKWQFLPAQSGTLRFASRIIIPIQFSLLEE